MGTILQSSPKNLRPDRNFSVQSSLDRKLQSGLASLVQLVLDIGAVGPLQLVLDIGAVGFWQGNSMFLSYHQPKFV